jgi:hypothetical protein
MIFSSKFSPDKINYKTINKKWLEYSHNPNPFIVKWFEAKR